MNTLIVNRQYLKLWKLLIDPQRVSSLHTENKSHYIMDINKFIHSDFSDISSKIAFVISVWNWCLRLRYWNIFTSSLTPFFSLCLCLCPSLVINFSHTHTSIRTHRHIYTLHVDSFQCHRTYPDSPSLINICVRNK